MIQDAVVDFANNFIQDTSGYHDLFLNILLFITYDIYYNASACGMHQINHLKFQATNAIQI